MTNSQVEEIKDQEEDIFEDLGIYDFQNEPQFYLHKDAKAKALQQLAVSEDSPFNFASDTLNENDLRRLRDERAILLRNETEEIKNQLELVKSRLSMLKKDQKDSKVSGTVEDQVEGRLSAIKQKSSLLKESKKGEKKPISGVNKEPKFRPLTGKVDCPNCECDRRKSVCDRCIQFKPKSSKVTSANNVRPWPTIEDERPIKPATNTRTLGVVEAVEDIVVPSRVYTISRSLNDKRTKLAQAIDELHLMIDQVKEQGDQLNRERKVAQLYKDQWKYGPSIGGPRASSREHLGPKNQAHKRSYESRLDADLARDTKSLMGFKSVESGMRFRHYRDNKNRIPLRKQPPNNAHSRSKSLESLPGKVSGRSKLNPRLNEHAEFRGVQPSKSSSDSNLSSKLRSELGNDEEEANQTDEECEVIVADSPPASLASAPSKVQHGHKENSTSERSNEGEVEGNTNIKRMTWVPVFGETEIKTVSKRPAQRKVQIIESNLPSNLGLKSSSPIGEAEDKRQPSGCSQGQKFGGSPAQQKAHTNVAPYHQLNNHIMNEANRKLKFASDLLEEEHRDSRSKNQLLIKRKPAAKLNLRKPTVNNSGKQPVATQTNPKVTVEHTHDRQTNLPGNTVQCPSMSRNDKQQLTILPVTVQCPSPCHCQQNSPGGSRRITQAGAKSTLISNLKDRLNKTKTKLARILEQERTKHLQLRLKVNSSLKKQSDLEYENELLKQSLSRCIDTCLNDISSTFESINDSLNETVLDKDNETTVATDRGSRGSEIKQVDGKVLCNAAQFIADNKHLRQMKQRVDNIERQRRTIFEELGREKQKNNLLELELKQSKAELSQIMDTKLRLEGQLTQLIASEAMAKNARSSIASGSPLNPLDTSAPEASKQVTKDDNHDQLSDNPNLATDKSTSELDDSSYSSVEAYRRYIQSMSPDIESIRRERKMILSEFDNIRRMLTEI